ncbi:MAG: ATP-binding protein [Candidatus Cloacimonadota bacterium]|nr:MAG: ATP-binding protein [Candidatus Cloacimonadota bacterium]PIE78541.1 MAG: ATP-binding protein [Candidatus Delongbacteria bacterium]
MKSEKNSPVVKFSNIVKTYENFKLSIDSFRVDQGEIVGVIGNNGVGKTTMLSLLSNLIKSDSGEIFVNGFDIYKSDKWKEDIGIYIDSKFLINHLYPYEYFSFIANIKKVSSKVLEERLSVFNKFIDKDLIYSKKEIKNLSEGNKKKVGIIGTFIFNPTTIILDEPFANLDPGSVIALQEIITKQNIENSTTFLISSHDLQPLSQVCSRVICIKDGKIEKEILKKDLSYSNLISEF